MRGCAISFLMRESVALLDSFLGSLIVPMSSPYKRKLFLLFP